MLDKEPSVAGKQPYGGEKQRVAIITDSAASIPEALRERYRIEVVPYWANMGADSYRSGIDLSPETFFERLRASPDLAVSTGVPSIETFHAAYHRQAQWAQHIVSIHLAGKQSATCSTAIVAARKSPVPVTVMAQPAEAR